jgi:hypothetical protein
MSKTSKREGLTMKYIGYNKETQSFKPFDSDSEPTNESHGSIFIYVIGPFKTRRAQKWSVLYGKNNPHFQHVNDAERLSK